MNDDRSAFWHSIAGQYATVMLLMAVSAGGLFLIGDPAGLIAMKTASVPLLFLASRGLDAIFISDASRRPWSAAFFERHFLDSVVFACWLTVVMWSPSLTAAGQIRSFLLTVTIMTAIKALLSGFGSESDDRQE
ncbi:hypothetical protein [Sinorhizobium meliloti]|uniref:hypothetical protein n=1 Tax=Rhizobium meliloti TaxID=382 RepID=UPI000FD7F718|nr:hypothetical protein [Sinorhizobium meliloti]RVJ49345.1 hypothetical protein CN175_21195 [Sinorhizobium meliloti]